MQKLPEQGKTATLVGVVRCWLRNVRHTGCNIHTDMEFEMNFFRGCVYALPISLLMWLIIWMVLR